VFAERLTVAAYLNGCIGAHALALLFGRTVLDLDATTTMNEVVLVL